MNDIPASNAVRFNSPISISYCVRGDAAGRVGGVDSSSGMVMVMVMVVVMVMVTVMVMMVVATAAFVESALAAMVIAQ